MAISSDWADDGISIPPPPRAPRRPLAEVIQQVAQSAALQAAGRVMMGVVGL